MRHEESIDNNLEERVRILVTIRLSNWMRIVKSLEERVRIIFAISLFVNIVG